MSKDTPPALPIARAGGEGLRVLLPVLLPTLVAAVVFLLYFRAQPHWLADPDAQDYAQLGRQLAAGRGPTTRYLPWNGLDYFAGRGTALDRTSGGGEAAPVWPNIVRFPLTPALMALGFVVAGPSDESVHLPAGLAFVLTAASAGWLGARVFGVWAGLLAGLAVTVLPLTVNYSLTGLTEPTLGLLILAVLGCLVRSKLVLGGVLFGLMILNRYDTALLIFPIMANWLLPRRDWIASTVRFLGPALAIVLPWAIYLTVVAGTPLFNLQPASIAAQASGKSDGLGWYLPEYASPWSAWVADPNRAVRIARDELAATPNYLRKLLGWPWLVAGVAACGLAVVRGVLRGRRSSAGRLAVFLVAAVLLRALLASILGLNLERHFVPLVPLLTVIVVGEAMWLVRVVAGRLAGVESVRRGVLVAGQAIVAAVVLLPSLWIIGPFLIPPSEPPGPPRGAGEVEARPENLTRLAMLVGPEQLVASNVPWSVAWQADRRAVPLPPTVEETARLERRYGISIDAIYVAGQVAIADAPRSWRAWDDLRRRGVPPPGYVLAESFSNGGRLFLKVR